MRWHSTLPVVMRGGHAVVSAKIDGEVFGLVVDTGAVTTAVTPEVVAALDLRPDPGMSAMRAAGIGGNAYSQVVGLDSLQLGGVTYRKIDVLAASLGELGRQSSLPVSGLIGEDLLSRYDIGLDIGHREISLYTTRGCASVAPPWGEATPILVRLSERNQLTIPVVLDGQALTALFDTGAAGNLVLQRGADRLRLTPQLLAADPAAPLQGIGERSVDSRVHRFTSLQVGSERLSAPEMRVSDAALDGIDLILGMPFLQERQVFLSHATAQMFVRSNAGAPALAEKAE